MEAAWLVKGVSWPEGTDFDRLEGVHSPEQWVIDAAKLSHAPKSPIWRPVTGHKTPSGAPPDVGTPPNRRAPSVLAAVASFHHLKIDQSALDAAELGGAGGVFDLGDGRWRAIGRFAAVELGGWRVVWLPVEGGDLEVVLFSPIRDGQLDALLAGLNQILARSARQAAVQRPLDLTIPALNLEMVADLRQELTTLGLGAIFDRRHSPDALDASLIGASMRWEAPPRSPSAASGEAPSGVEGWDMTRPTVMMVQTRPQGAVLALGLMRKASP